MHEMSVASSLVKELLTRLERMDVKKVEEVHVEIGELAFISQAQLGFCFEVLAKENELLVNAKLLITVEEAKFRCKGCDFIGNPGQKQEPEDHTLLQSFACPECGGSLEVLQGREIVLKDVSIQIEEDRHE